MLFCDIKMCNKSIIFFYELATSPAINGATLFENNRTGRYVLTISQ